MKRRRKKGRREKRERQKGSAEKTNKHKSWKLQLSSSELFSLSIESGVEIKRPGGAAIVSCMQSVIPIGAT